MPTPLHMAQVQSIAALHESGYSNRKIAQLLGVHRSTVAKYLADREAVPSKPDPRVRSGPQSACEPFRELILDKLEQGLEGQRIYQDLRDEDGFTASYSSVRRFIGGLRQTHPLPVRRLETAPGEEAQVDFGTGAIVVSDGRRRRPWILRVVLSHSRKGYCEAVWRQTTDNFILCLENAFQHFGGVPARLVIDNLKAAVARADWYDPEVHPKLQSFAQHYGTAFLPTKPYRPDHKGKVENGVKYVKRNALQGRTFSSLVEQNDFLQQWEARVADTRIHGTTKRQVQKCFDEFEVAALRRLPKDRFPCFQEARRSVCRDGHAEVDKAFYSAPPEYVGRRVWARWDGRMVRLFNDQWDTIAVHVKTEPGRFRTSNDHLPKEKVSLVERGANAVLRQVAAIGPQTRDWAQAVMQARGVEAVRVLVGLKSLAKKHDSADLEQACQTALSYGAYRLRTVRELLKRQRSAQQQFEFLEEHPVIRPLSDYSLASIAQFRKDRHDDRRPI